MQATLPLLRFLQAARGAGIRISPAESIDAIQAVNIIGYADRTALRDTLALVLAKSPSEKQALAECFDLYFHRDHRAIPTEAPPHPDPHAFSPEPPLSHMLLANDAATLATALESAAEASGVQNIRFFTQRNLYLRRVLDRMGLRDTEREIADLRHTGTPADRALAHRLETGLASLRSQARDLIDRNLLLFARGENQEFRDELLKSTRLSNLDRRDYERMRVLVHAIARKLATRYARPRRRRLRGQLDVRRTVRRNMGWGGVPFITLWKERRIERPRLMVLCDVSGSVAAMAQFLLMFLYALNDALADIRAFAFAGSLMEVTDILEREPIEPAIAKILGIIGFGSSNYGNALADFADGWIDQVDRKTTVLILGDARGNRTDPRIDILQRVSTRSKRLIWLNPEYRTAWGTGDSDMFRYAPHCHLLRPCTSLRDLERIVTDMLETAAAA